MPYSMSEFVTMLLCEKLDLKLPPMRWSLMAHTDEDKQYRAKLTRIAYEEQRELRGNVRLT